MFLFTKNTPIIPYVILSVLIPSWNSLLFAGETGPTDKTNVAMQEHTNPSESPSVWKIFGGVGTGFGVVSSSDYHDSLHGQQVLLSGLLTYQISKWVFDGGANWSYSNISGTNNQDLPIQIRTRTGMLELSPRYRIGPRWQLGPVYNLAFGTDTAFGPTVGNTVGSSFLGLKAVYEFPFEKFPLRLWSQLSTDISIPERQATFVLAGIQIGIPIYAASQPNTPKQIEVTTTQLPPDKPHQVIIELDTKKVFFSTASAKIRPEVKTLLSDVGSYLEQNDQKWESLEISGHADRRGRFKYNMDLSKHRAESVKRSLIQDNELESREKIKVRAFSYLKPLDPHNTPDAWSKNRRVELVFHNVVDEGALRDKLKKLTSEPSVK